MQRAKSVIELQPFREITRIAVEGSEGGPTTATLISLNPYINAWFVLRLDGRKGRIAEYHLENPDPDQRQLGLDPEYPWGIVITAGDERFLCALWPAGTPSPLTEARDSRRSFAPLCGARLYLRNQAEGHKTPKEWVTDFLRDHVWRGDEITGVVLNTFFRDAYLATSKLEQESKKREADAPGAPPSPLLRTGAADQVLVPVGLGITLEREEASGLAVGRWYAAQDNPGVFVSVVRPDLVSPLVVEAQKGRVDPLDATESQALVYLVAFDLDAFDLGFGLGTEHPRVGWSDQVGAAVRNDALPGPDGIGTVEPLARAGMLNPIDAGRVAATFTGGFKRTHGAFAWSDLSRVNRGSHYGFIESGVVLSKLQPGLATTIVFDDGAVELKTWKEEDDVDLPWVRHARQNGVPVLDYDPSSGETRPGGLVRQWGPGNWSGSVEKQLRTLRAGLCLQEAPSTRFLTYGYFSSATPSAMARVFQAYECRYAMLLDMNALEHTYLALYRVQDSQLLVQHLIDGMNVVDKSRNEQYLPRFVGFADNRDFFYLLRRRNR